MDENKWTIDDLEGIYLSEYEEDDLTEEEMVGDDVMNFLNWCRNHLSHLE